MGMLIKYGVDTDVTDDSGETDLHIAATPTRLLQRTEKVFSLMKDRRLYFTLIDQKARNIENISIIYSF